jgi:hypothetical protein
VNLFHTLHQTRLSRALRQLPGVSGVVTALWHRHQASAVAVALERVEFADNPVRGSVQRIDAGQNSVRASGRRFAERMSAACGSEKFFSLGYETFYGSLFETLATNEPVILEIGLGVNDPSAPSGMPLTYHPGESLRGLATYFPGAQVHGADIDPRALKVTVEGARIHWADQRVPSTLTALAIAIGQPIDIVIDDGLHTPEANANTIAAFVPYLSSSGFIIVEDILPEFRKTWLVALRVSPFPWQYFPAESLGPRAVSDALVVWRQ